MTRSLVAPVLALVLLAACKAAPAPTPPSTDAPQDASPSASAQAPASTQADGPTGALDEAAFKALHEHTTAAAPRARGEMLEIAGARAYLSLPEDASPPLPAVLVIHEWWGLNDHIKHWADRLAADGYAALAIDLYGGEVATTPDEAMALMKAVDEARAREVLTAAHRLLGEDPRIGATRRGVIGWCFGGGWSLQHAIATPDLDAAVIYYGRLVTDEAALARIHAPLLGVFADQDQGIPPAAVEEFRAAVERAGKSIELHRYPANHAFANPSSARYQQDAAADAWAKVRAFLQRTLK
ncbi:MAG: dienelactone hydrolase family protein [Nannocystaceae bacterium]|nr:dienelactone hydrolase family protein [Myxococcales bacterium]